MRRDSIRTLAAAFALFSFVFPGIAMAQDSVRDIVDRLGLGKDLVLVLDAADARSYPGTGQTWFDVSGQGNDFYLGADGEAASHDPAFVGTAGSSEAYFEASGLGQFFKATGAHAFMNDWHKAGGAFTLIAVEFYPRLPDSSAYLLSNQHETLPGVRVLARRASGNDGRMAVQHFNGRNRQSFTPISEGVVPEGSWFLAAVSFTEGSGASFQRVNLNTQSFIDDNRAAPSRADAADWPHIWAEGDGSHNPSPHMRIQAEIAWDRALTEDEVAAFFEAVKAARPQLDLP